MYLTNIMSADIPKIKIKRKKQHGVFLNRYDFAYAGIDTKNTDLNTFKRNAPGLIENAGNKIGKVTEKRTGQIIIQGGKELERVAPIILKKAIVQLYKTPFRLLGKFSR